MAEETRPRGLVTSLGEGASPSAPTAPHTSEPAEGAPLTKPARFWGGHRAVFRGVTTVLVSLAVHYVVQPWSLLPKPEGIEFKDVDDSLTIPVDLLGEEAPPAPPSPAPPESAADTTGTGTTRRDGGTVSDAGPRDAGDVDRDGGAAAFFDAGGEALATDAGFGPLSDGGEVGDSGVAMSDAGANGVAGGPRDPGSMIGMAGLAAAGTVNVTLLLNISEIRKHPIGTRLGPLLAGIPQWNEFIHGAQTKFDPVQHTEWILIYGPSLIHTERDAVIVRTNAPDVLVDKAIEQVSSKTDKGGPFDAGVPGVRAFLGYADQAPRAILRAQPNVIVVVPPDKANEFAKVMKRAPISPKVRPGEAMRLVVKDPWRQISIPGLKFPQSLNELRIWVVPNADGSADVYGEGDCTDAESAVTVAETIRQIIARQNSSMLVRMGTRGLLNTVDIQSSGKMVTLHAPATKEQMEAILQLVAAQMGVTLPAAAP